MYQGSENIAETVVIAKFLWMIKCWPGAGPKDSSRGRIPARDLTNEYFVPRRSLSPTVGVMTDRALIQMLAAVCPSSQ